MKKPFVDRRLTPPPGMREYQLNNRILALIAFIFVALLVYGGAMRFFGYGGDDPILNVAVNMTMLVIGMASSRIGGKKGDGQ